MLLQRNWDEVAVSAFCWKLAGWQAAYRRERERGKREEREGGKREEREGPLQ